VADGAHEPDAAVLSRGPMGARPGDLAPRGRPRPANAPPLVCVSDAGPCGAWRSRELTTQGPGCGVVTPALRPQPAGARVPTARREAVPRACLRRAGARTPVSVPQGAADARRERTRARNEARRARAGQGPGRLAIPPRAVGLATAAWQPTPTPSRLSGGRR
jgi:hypothetical protein